MKIIGNYFKEIPELLKALNINYTWVFKNVDDFSRTIKFKLFGVDYYFEFWSNLVNLYISKYCANKLAFTTIEVYTHLSSSDKSLALDDNFYITLEPLAWQLKYLGETNERN